MKRKTTLSALLIIALLSLATVAVAYTVIPGPTITSTRYFTVTTTMTTTLPGGTVTETVVILTTLIVINSTVTFTVATTTSLPQTTVTVTTGATTTIEGLTYAVTLNATPQSQWLVFSSYAPILSVKSSLTGAIPRVASSSALNATRIGAYCTSISAIPGNEGACLQFTWYQQEGWFYDTTNDLLFIHYLGDNPITLFILV